MQVPHSVDAATIETLLNRGGWRLGLGGELEQEYRRDYLRRTIPAFHKNVFFVMFLYLLLCSGIYYFIPEKELYSWLALYASVGVIIAGNCSLSFVPSMQKYFAYYVWVGSFLAVAVSILVTVFVLDPIASQLTQAALIYCIIVVCSLVGLRVKQAFYALILGGLAGGLLIWIIGKEINWVLLHRTFTASSMLGLVLAYHVERLDRESFLKARLLQVINEKTEEHAGRLDKLSRQDGLTGLANRRHFDEIFQEEWARAVRQQYPITLLMIDIDHFKHYNDTLGHVRGDGCLRKVASIIAAHARRPGDLAVRYGGEEFLLFFPNMEKMKACQQAERLVQSFQEARMQQAPGLNKEFLSVSVGVATVIPGNAMVEASELVCAADDALYEAKHAGRNGWRYAAGISEAHDTSASA